MLCVLNNHVHGGFNSYYSLHMRAHPSHEPPAPFALIARQREKKQTMAQRSLSGIPLLDDNRSFSLIFRGAKTLDIMVDEGVDREMILYVLNSIVTEYGRAKVKVGNEVLLLRYIWNDVDRVRKLSDIVST